jgi:copper(I)-binding protein
MVVKPIFKEPVVHRFKFQFLLAIALTVGAILAFSLSVRAGNLNVDKAYATASMGAGKTGAVYFMIMNQTETADRIIAASTPAARKAEVHNHLMEDGIMKMRKVDAVDIPSGGHVMFEPGGYHVMLFGLEKPLKAGETIEVELVFEHAGKMTVTVPVKSHGQTMEHKHGS